MQSYDCMPRSAFSLVELSIVLVILGLLTGGILSGQSLIRAAELRSVSNQTARLVTSVHTFRDKYFALPGDMANATAFWGIVDADATVCARTEGSGTQTCNGDGNGLITSTGALWYQEVFRFWQHLANAGLIEGSYTGVQASASSWHSIPGVNVMAGRLSSSGFYMHARTNNASGGGWFAATGKPYGNLLRLGATTAGSWPSTPLLKAEEAWNLDTKLDDGRPAFGDVMSLAASAYPGCATTDTEATAEYDLDDGSISCVLLIKSGV